MRTVADKPEYQGVHWVLPAPMGTRWSLLGFGSPAMRAWRKERPILCREPPGEPSQQEKTFETMANVDHSTKARFSLVTSFTAR